MRLILAILYLANLFDLIKCFEEPVPLIVVQWIRGPCDYTARLIVETSVNGSVLALADAVVMLDELVVGALANYCDGVHIFPMVCPVFLRGQVKIVLLVDRLYPVR